MEPTAMDATLAIIKNGAQNGIKSKKAKKNSLIRILKRSNFGTAAKSKVTLKIEPS